MKIRLYGTHLSEARSKLLAGCLIDGVIAIDAGSITAALSAEEQLIIQAILLTHHHFDHIKDLPMLGATFSARRKTLSIFSTSSVFDAVKYIFSYPAKLYTDFFEQSGVNPTFKFTVISPLQPFRIGDYEIVAVPVNHSAPAVGFQVTAPGGKNLFYSGDTGPGLEECWRHISPDLIIIETSTSDRFIKMAREVKHLSPALLKEELVAFRNLKGYLPPVVTTHHFPDPREDTERKEELARVSQELGVSITLGYDGLVVDV